MLRQRRVEPGKRALPVVILEAYSIPSICLSSQIDFFLSSIEGHFYSHFVGHDCATLQTATFPGAWQVKITTAQILPTTQDVLKIIFNKYKVAGTTLGINNHATNGNFHYSEDFSIKWLQYMKPT